MSVSIVIATFGDDAWSELAWSRAYPSALGQTDDIVVYHDPDGTLASVRNRGAEIARGQWLVYLDASDELCADYVDEMNNELDELGPGDWMLAPALGRPGKLPVIPNAGKWPRTSECCIGTMIPRALFRGLGGFRERSDDGTPLTMYEDWDVFLRLWDAGAQLVHVPSAVYCAHGEQRNVTGNWQSVYDAIWADHEKRVAVPA